VSAIPPVLYAEDDENDAFFMERAFKKLNARDALRLVPNGREAVNYLAGNGSFADRQASPLPAVVLLDVKMPVLSGLEALAWIRSRREFDALPVVMFTSSTQQRDVDVSRQHGANAYIVKPSNADNLSRLVSSVLEAARSLPTPSWRLPLEGNVL
jgi:CheY-like chemotaxis protein